MKRKARQLTGTSSPSATKQQRTTETSRKKRKTTKRRDTGPQLRDEVFTMAIQEGELLTKVLRDMSSALQPFANLFTPGSQSPQTRTSSVPLADALQAQGSLNEGPVSFDAAIAKLKLASHCMKVSGDALSSYATDSLGIELKPVSGQAVKKKRAKKVTQPSQIITMEPNVAEGLNHQESTTRSSGKSPKKTSTVSDYFDPFTIEPTPPGLVFKLAPSGFGLIQERICNDLWALVVQTILWNQTTAKAGRPVLFKLLSDYPTPEAMAEADYDDVLAIIGRLGLQKKRSRLLIKLAQTWLISPPDPARRYVKKNYPNPGDNWNLTDGALLDRDDLRPGFEISHLPGVGPYAIDSYRIFYRDTLRGVRNNANEVIEPEWKRVVPLDKDLRAYLIWKWRQEGWDWNKLTGERTRIAEPNQA